MEAPRWSLRNAHYLNVEQLLDGTKIEWEHKEVNTANGRMARKLYPVPMLLDPQEPSDCNYRGEVIVAHKVEGVHNLRDDYIFHGEPTPEMEPWNAEAQAITDSLQDKWIHPINSLPVNGGMNEAEMAFMERLMKTFAGAAAQPNQSVPQAEYDVLKERLAKLEAILAAQPKPEATVRRV